MNTMIGVLLIGLWGLFAPAQSSISWTSLHDGLELGTMTAPLPSPVADRRITIVRIDPAYWKFSLLTAAQHGKQARTAKQWATEFGQTAVINAGMFQMDGLTNVGYMKENDRINNPRFNDDNTLIAFEPKAEGLPKFQIIDRDCQDWRKLADSYQNVTQGIRMVDCHRKNRWSAQPRKWSMAVMGIDKEGRALMIFCRSPYPVHDFVEMMLGADLDMQRAMYLEGGPEASLYLKTADCEFNGFGSYETGFYESDGNDRAWPIPNVIGIARRNP